MKRIYMDGRSDRIQGDRLRSAGESMNCRMEINVRGIVQGVGFRPFVYNLAGRHQLLGYVLNDGAGVSIDVEGEKASVEAFFRALQKEPPPLAVIFEIRGVFSDPVGYTDFTIRQSEADPEKFVPISPEIATCDDCLRELFDPSDRRHRYPFINCTNCGPRFTIVKDVPYDRKFTTMEPFPMCGACRKEYEDPENRRFHAQPNACPACGPQLSLLGADGREIPVSDVVAEACRLLKEGFILAVKGLGGYHLACDASDERAVGRLRSRKFREFKPFALMVRDIPQARSLCLVGEEEEHLLRGRLRPIVLLRKREDCPAAGSVAPNQRYHGIMLPYTPLHHLLLAESGLVLVMTSGNISSEPIVYHDAEGLRRLKGIADFYLLHNREIHIRTDDSVTRVCRGKSTVLRRSRGYAPFPLLMNKQFEGRILACGAELKNTFCLTRSNYAFLSHHIGDLENLETLTSFETGIEHFKRIFNISPDCVAYDLHPEYLSTRYALSLAGLSKIGVQHHHAHIVSCMGDNGLAGEVIGVSFDGTGYGTDGRIWGGEFLICSESEFRRSGHLEYMALPGSERAIKEPWRMGVSCLSKFFGEAMWDLDIDFVRRIDANKARTIARMIHQKINSPLTSSAGRLFDAVSALAGVRDEVHYEGQAAIELEMAAGREDGSYPFDIQESGDAHIVQLEPLIRALVSDLSRGLGAAAVAARFHNTMSDVVLAMSRRLRDATGIERIALSGGVFQNIRFLERTTDLLERGGFTVFTHHRVPPNDGGIALGQALVASAMRKKARQ